MAKTVKAVRDVGGRPTKLTQELVDKANDYVDNHEMYGDPVPLMAGLAIVLNVNRSTVFEWAKDVESGFSDVAEKVMLNQERRLVGKGLTKEFDSATTRTMLTKHGYAEKSEVHNTHSFDQISDEELNARIESLEQRLSQ